jgi:hypothetical protein
VSGLRGAVAIAEDAASERKVRLDFIIDEGLVLPTASCPASRARGADRRGGEGLRHLAIDARTRSRPFVHAAAGTPPSAA